MGTKRTVDTGKLDKLGRKIKKSLPTPQSVRPHTDTNTATDFSTPSDYALTESIDHTSESFDQIIHDNTVTLSITEHTINDAIRSSLYDGIELAQELHDTGKLEEATTQEIIALCENRGEEWVEDIHDDTNGNNHLYYLYSSKNPISRLADLTSMTEEELSENIRDRLIEHAAKDGIGQSIADNGDVTAMLTEISQYPEQWVYSDHRENPGGKNFHEIKEQALSETAQAFLDDLDGVDTDSEDLYDMHQVIEEYYCGKVYGLLLDQDESTLYQMYVDSGGGEEHIWYENSNGQIHTPVSELCRDAVIVDYSRAMSAVTLSIRDNYIDSMN